MFKTCRLNFQRFWKGRSVPLKSNLEVLKEKNKKSIDAGGTSVQQSTDNFEKSDTCGQCNFMELVWHR